MAHKAYKFRIYPNDTQEILFARTFGCVRMVYNHWLNQKIKQYKENKTNLTYTVCAKEMAVMKKTKEYAFLREVDSISLQQSLRHINVNIKMYIFDHLRMYIFAILPLDRYIFLSDMIFL